MFKYSVRFRWDNSAISVSVDDCYPVLEVVSTAAYRIQFPEGTEARIMRNDGAVISHAILINDAWERDYLCMH